VANGVAQTGGIVQAPAVLPVAALAVIVNEAHPVRLVVGIATMLVVAEIMFVAGE